MSFLSIKIIRLNPQAMLPSCGSSHSAGFDLASTVSCRLEVGQRELIGTGLALAIPPGFEGQIRPRSGLALNQGLTVLNSPGTIDADYRGEIKVLCINLGQEPVTITCGLRMAQLVIAPVLKVSFLEVDVLEETQRGQGGFGSTGSF